MFTMWNGGIFGGSGLEPQSDLNKLRYRLSGGQNDRLSELAIPLLPGPHLRHRVRGCRVCQALNLTKKRTTWRAFFLF